MSIAYLEKGQGTPLVLLHGIGSAARSFAAQLDAFSSHWRVLAWDAPGYGASEALPMAHPTAADYAAALERFLRERGVSEFHLLGHSLGCLMAAAFAARHPGRVRSLTLCSIAGGHSHLPEAERRKLLDQRLQDVASLGPQGMAEKRAPRLLGPAAPPEALAKLVDTMGSVHPDGYAQAARMLSTGDIVADITRLPAAMPGQVIFGDADVITPPARNREIAGHWPGATVHVIAGAGHALYLEQPQAFNALLADFLER
ncbi:alpha/beta fold hydrolase [Reyranella soli]|uniref:Hydrolase n=1 Tax=Reyranella soli TaxID=1230389 RepID=A0A512N6D2_9HYPH|nr:alpha/beta fold hydrolase [Reyranella soli]GEP54552.1 hydrolase [Reyranella soli]